MSIGRSNMSFYVAELAKECKEECYHKAPHEHTESCDGAICTKTNKHCKCVEEKFYTVDLVRLSKFLNSSWNLFGVTPVVVYTSNAHVVVTTPVTAVTVKMVNVQYVHRLTSLCTCSRLPRSTNSSRS